MKKNNTLKEVLQELNYGEINSKLDKIMEDRKISTYELSTKANIRFQTITALRKNEATRIDFGVLAKLCYTLNLKVGDIIEYKETTKEEK